MPELRAVEQTAFDEQVVEDEEIEQALEDREKKKSSLDAVRKVYDGANEHAMLKISELELPEGGAARRRAFPDHPHVGPRRTPGVRDEGEQPDPDLRRGRGVEPREAPSVGVLDPQLLPPAMAQVGAVHRLPDRDRSSARARAARMTALRIAKDLELPVDAVTQAIAILARKGAGKTYTASVIVEEVVRANVPVVVLDPTGAWWGLRTSVGGDHADVALEPTAGATIADVVSGLRLPEPSADVPPGGIAGSPCNVIDAPDNGAVEATTYRGRLP